MYGCLSLCVIFEQILLIQKLSLCLPHVSFSTRLLSTGVEISQLTCSMLWNLNEYNIHHICTMASNVFAWSGLAQLSRTSAFCHEHIVLQIMSASSILGYTLRRRKNRPETNLQFEIKYSLTSADPQTQLFHNPPKNVCCFLLLSFVIISEITSLQQKLNDIGVILISGLRCYSVIPSSFNLMILVTIDDYRLEPLFHYGFKSGDILSLLFLINVFLPEGSLRRYSQCREESIKLNVKSRYMQKLQIYVYQMVRNLQTKGRSLLPLLANHLLIL